MITNLAKIQAPGSRRRKETSSAQAASPACDYIQGTVVKGYTTPGSTATELLQLAGRRLGKEARGTGAEKVVGRKGASSLIVLLLTIRLSAWSLFFEEIFHAEGRTVCAF